MEFSRWQNDGKGGLIAHVNVIKADGTTYEAPISEFRSADDDDPIRVYDSEKLFDHLIAENQLIGVLNKTGYLSKLNAPNLKSSGAKETPAIITNKYAAQIQGVSEAEAWQQTLNKSKNPAKIRIEAFKLAEKSFTNSYGDTLYIAQDGSLVPEGTEGARAPTQQDIYDKANSFMDYSQGASPQQSEQTAPDDLINQAKAAISNGADQRAVIQRLIDKGYTKEQILQQFQ